MRRTRFVAAVLVSCVLAGASSAQSAPPESRRRTAVVEAVAAVSPAVVNISTQRLVRRARQHPLDRLFDFGDLLDDRSRLANHSLGSGVIVDPKGYAVTNDHVIRMADKIVVSLQDGRSIEARVVGKDSDNDIAVLRLLDDGPFPTVDIARSHDLMLGETTIALGNPFGLVGSVTTGILSSFDRTVEFRGRTVFEDFLQTSAVINPGNSGGPLVNLDGELMGINVAIHSRGPGIGFAIPAARIREVLYKLLEPEVAKGTWLGIDVVHDRESPGAVVERVDGGSPADRAGVRAGDLLVTLQGRRLRDWIDFQTTVDSLDEGDELTLGLLREGERETLALRLEEAPPSDDDRAAFAAVGFEFRDIAPALRADAGLDQGVVVTRVLPDSGAERVGLREGDVVYQLGNFAVRDKDHAKAVLRRYLQRGYRGLRISVYRQETGENLGGDVPFAIPGPGSEPQKTR